MDRRDIRKRLLDAQDALDVVGYLRRDMSIAQQEQLIAIEQSLRSLRAELLHEDSLNGEL